MGVLIVGFDSAWSTKNRGAVVAAILRTDGTVQEEGLPRSANFEEAEIIIHDWEDKFRPDSTVILIDQPTIVRNRTGQRPAEHIVASPVGRRRGGVQPAINGPVNVN
jgi:predicted RNase H-like nuclease